jgi:hypothetical protein
VSDRTKRLFALFVTLPLGELAVVLIVWVFVMVIWLVQR